jgi:ectoine hydroxylase-related dioxygenase (phytanoyl-CoA dioxygenase family)
VEIMVDQDIVDSFWRDGAACVRGAFSPEWVEELRAATRRVVDEPGPFRLNLSKSDEDGRFVGELFLWQRDEGFKRFAFESPASKIAAAFLKRPEVRLFYDYLLVKFPGPGNKTPWHQDLPFYPVAGREIVSLWIAMDPVTQLSGGVTYVAGSHLWGRQFQPQAFSGASSFAGTTYETIPDIDGEPDKYRLLHWDLDPGDCLVHHVLTVHGAPANRASITRRGLAVRWMGADVRFDPRERTAPAIRAMAQDPEDPVAPGAPLANRNFPAFAA